MRLHVDPALDICFLLNMTALCPQIDFILRRLLYLTARLVDAESLVQIEQVLSLKLGWV